MRSVGQYWSPKCKPDKSGVRLFYSYSHKDENLRDGLELHLIALQRQGILSSWHDRKITAGRLIDREIARQMERADLILLLVSPDFLASAYCYGIEVKKAMCLYKKGAAIVIPVILRPCDWDRTPFGRLLATPRDGKPVTTWSNKDRAFLDIENSIKSAINARSREAVIHNSPGF